MAYWLSGQRHSLRRVAYANVGFWWSQKIFSPNLVYKTLSPYTQLSSRYNRINGPTNATAIDLIGFLGALMAGHQTWSCSIGFDTWSHGWCRRRQSSSSSSTQSLPWCSVFSQRKSPNTEQNTQSNVLWLGSHLRICRFRLKFKVDLKNDFSLMTSVLLVAVLVSLIAGTLNTPG